MDYAIYAEVCDEQVEEIVIHDAKDMLDAINKAADVLNSEHSCSWIITHTMPVKETT
jgi:hypothetical protein